MVLHKHGKTDLYVQCHSHLHYISARPTCSWRPTCSERIRFAQTMHQWLFCVCVKGQWACCCRMNISMLYKLSSSYIFLVQTHIVWHFTDLKQNAGIYWYCLASWFLCCCRSFFSFLWGWYQSLCDGIAELHPFMLLLIWAFLPSHSAAKQLNLTLYPWLKFAQYLQWSLCKTAGY